MQKRATPSWPRWGLAGLAIILASALGGLDFGAVTVSGGSGPMISRPGWEGPSTGSPSRCRSDLQS